MRRNGIKCKYMFMFSLKNLARKGLIPYMLIFVPWTWLSLPFTITRQWNSAGLWKFSWWKKKICIPHIVSTMASDAQLLVLPGHQQPWYWHHYLRIFQHQQWMAGLTHWGRDKMAAFSQTTFSNAFSSIKMFELRIKFHWSLFLMVQLTIFQHWFR